MTDNSKISRRTFVGSAISTAAVSSIPLQNLMAFSRQGASSPASSHWKDEGVLYVDKSPYAKLHSVPVHAVTITAGFWGARREINVEKSIPSMEQLLEANGRMNNFLRLVGKERRSRSTAPSSRTPTSTSGRKPSVSRCSLEIFQRYTRKADADH